MSTRVDTEEIESTRSEKLLAVCLAAFLLVGTAWFYVKVPSWVENAVPSDADYSLVEEASDAQTTAWDTSYQADQSRDEARIELDLSREEYSLAITKQEGVARAKETYEQNQRAYDEASAEAKRAQEQAEEADRAYEKAQATYDEESQSGLRAWLTALIRLLFVAGLVAGAYSWIARQRSRESRYLPLGFAAAGVGALMALVFAIDYITDYIDPLDLGPFVLSAIGVAATVVAFAVLQRHIAARVPGRRVRKGECPFCGFPLHDSGLDAGHHCAGCGREVVAPCAACALAALRGMRCRLTQVAGRDGRATVSHPAASDRSASSSGVSSVAVPAPPASRNRSSRSEFSSTCRYSSRLPRSLGWIPSGAWARSSVSVRTQVNPCRRAAARMRGRMTRALCAREVPHGLMT